MSNDLIGRKVMHRISAESIDASKIKVHETLFTAKEAAELQQYRKIGTVEELREARQKQEPMQADENDYCPICFSYGRDEEGIAGYFCPNCGQALKFTEREENEWRD